MNNSLQKILISNWRCILTLIGQVVQAQDVPPHGIAHSLETIVHWDYQRSNLRNLGLALGPEAEYRAMTVATAELTWLTFLLNDLHVELPSTPVLYCDNARTFEPILRKPLLLGSFVRIHR